MTTNHKAARRVNEQYHCHHCGKQWDHDDPDPPECKRELIPETHDDSVCSPANPCEECNDCSIFCDVCGFWHPKDDPCRYH